MTRPGSGQTSVLIFHLHVNKKKWTKCQARRTVHGAAKELFLRGTDEGRETPRGRTFVSSRKKTNLKMQTTVETAFVVPIFAVRKMLLIKERDINLEKVDESAFASMLKVSTMLGTCVYYGICWLLTFLIRCFFVCFFPLLSSLSVSLTLSHSRRYADMRIERTLYYFV